MTAKLIRMLRRNLDYMLILLAAMLLILLVMLIARRQLRGLAAEGIAPATHHILTEPSVVNVKSLYPA